MFSSYYYRKLINLPTGERNRTYSLLDNIYTNIPDSTNTCTSGVLKFLAQSDHYPIFIIINKIEQPKPKIHIKIANSFNNYFSNVGNSLARSIKSENGPLVYLQTNIKSIYIPELDKIQIKSTISSIINSASGYDQLLASIMKQCIDSYSEQLTVLINKSIQQEVFPVEFKIARIIPLCKGENNQPIHNYRPISVLPFFLLK